jgi:hypothetical protein
MKSRNRSPPPLVGVGKPFPAMAATFVGVRSRVRSVLVMPTRITSGMRPSRARKSTTAAVCAICRSPSVMYSTG